MTGVLDKIGMFCSSICAVHCVLMPFVLVMLPYASIAWFNNEMFEVAFVLSSLLIASFALAQGYAIHKKKTPLVLASLGFAILLGITFVLEHHHDHDHGHGMHYWSALAGCIVLASHILNHKWCHKHKNCSCSVS